MTTTFIEDMQNARQVTIATKDEAYAVGLIQLLNRHFKVTVTHVRSEEEVLQQLPRIGHLILDASTVVQFLDLKSIAQQCRLFVVQETAEELRGIPSLFCLPKEVDRQVMLLAFNRFFDQHKTLPLAVSVSYPHLSSSEQYILEQLCAGYTFKEIASLLDLSHKTSQSYRRSLLEKLQAKNTAHLVYRCLKMLPQASN